MEFGAPSPRAADEWRLDLVQPFASIRRLAKNQARLIDASGDHDALLDLLLLVCAAEQVLADHLVAGTLDLSPLTRRSSSRALETAVFAAELASGWLRGGRLALRDHRMVEMLGRIRELAVELATAMAGGAPPTAARVASAFAGPLPPELADRRMKVPICFKGVDLMPEDCFELARRFAQTRKPGPVVVVGIRTSGSYMAPLCAGWLVAAGWPARYVTVRTTRPAVWVEHRAWSRSQGRNPHVLLVDDPPVTASAQASTARLLLKGGVEATRLTLLVPRIWEEDPSEVDRALSPYHTVELPPSELSLRRVLVGEDTAEWVRDLCGSTHTARPLWTLDEIHRIARRHHVKQIFDVPGYGRVVVKGAGLGWFGWPARLAAKRLGGWTPSVLGSRSGLLAFRWEDGATVQGGARSEMGRYAGTRLSELPLPVAVTAPRRYRQDGWGHAARLLSGAYGRLAVLQRARLRSALIEAAAGGAACVVDARMSRDDWLEAGGRLVKTDFEEHAYDHEDLAWFDPAYDLAGALLELGPSRAAAAELLSGYASAGGDPAVSRRLPIAELVYGALMLRDRMLLVQETREDPGWEATLQAALSAEAALTWAIDAALADAFPVAGAIGDSDLVWSLDVDGVLEDSALGFPSTTPAGAAAVQLMRAGGSVVLLNSGRSLAELQLRCDALGFDGGIGEYGSVVWDQKRGRPETLVEAREERALNRLRDAAAEMRGVHVDSRYRCSVRCRRLVGDSLRALAEEDANRLARAGGPEARMVQGYLQTDFHAASIDKGVGLRSALDLLGIGGAVVAVGDTASDLPMLKAARRAYIPANAAAEVRSAGVRLRRSRQNGLLEAARTEHGRRPIGKATDGAVHLTWLLAARDAARLTRLLTTLVAVISPSPFVLP